MRRLAFAVASLRPLSTLASLQSHAIIPSLSVIADRYDAILLDQFGVLHDGTTAIPGAIDCFNNLAAAGKKLIVLSNTSRRRAFALSKLPKLGFDPAMLTGFVTSGEAAWEYMRASCVFCGSAGIPPSKHGTQRTWTVSKFASHPPASATSCSARGLA
jgi:phosphoglycolate phosphatase-like HAD superfamily hydrolase